MTLQIFSALLFCVSILTGLTVEGLKIMTNKKFASNVIAAIVSIIIGTIVSVSYYIIVKIAFDFPVIISIVAFIYLSWLSAMLGYDKVIQMISQVKLKRTNGGV